MDGRDLDREPVWFIGSLLTLPASPDLDSFDVWHDRAVFHFLTNPADRTAYVTLLNRTISVGRYAVIATFAPDGPEKCSGQPSDATADAR